jgi:hypothetical protein
VSNRRKNISNFLIKIFENNFNFNTTILSIMTFSITTLSITTLSITTLSIMTFSITINETRHSAK